MEHVPVFEPVFAATIVILFFCLLLSYFYFQCTSDSELINSLVRSLQENHNMSVGGFLCFWGTSTALFLYFLFSLAIYTQVNTDTPESIITTHAVLRYTAYIVFIVSASLWGWFTALYSEKALGSSVAMLPTILPLVCHFVLLGTHASQVLVPGTDSECDCSIQVVSITSFIAGLLYTPLLVFDIIWSYHYYVKKKNYVRVTETMGQPPVRGLVLQTVELGEASL